MNILVRTDQTTELIDITSQVSKKIRSAGIDHGVCMIYVPHTTAAVTINESADPAVKADIKMVLDKVIPWKGGYQHLEGNSAAHVKSSLIGASELIAIEKGRLVLGRWQGIFFCEFDGPRTRKVNIQIIPNTPSD